MATRKLATSKKNIDMITEKRRKKGIVRFGMLLTPFVLLLVLFYLAEPGKETITDVIDQVRQQVAPDRRVAVFDISVEQKTGGWLLTGELDNTQAHETLLDALESAGVPDITDAITVLPHPDLGERKYGLVKVSVGNMRAQPRYSTELVTQVLMGTPLRVLKRSRSWYYVQSPDGYLGWMSFGGFERVTEKQKNEWLDAPKIIVTAYHGIIYEEPAGSSLPVSNVSLGNRLLRLDRNGEWILAALPDGRSGYLHESLLEDYDVWKENQELLADNLIRTAKQFIGFPYLWGGTSAKGLDCSGLTKLVYWLNGMDLSRDASQQIRMGHHVEVGKEFEQLEPGDLLFFGRKETPNSPERIVHVGLYIGNREFIHSSEMVRINSLDPGAPNFDRFEYNRFVRARRLLPSPS